VQRRQRRNHLLYHSLEIKDAFEGDFELEPSDAAFKVCSL